MSTELFAVIKAADVAALQRLRAANSGELRMVEALLATGADVMKKMKAATLH